MTESAASTALRIAGLAIAAGAVLGTIVLLAPILTPFALGAVLAYILRPGAARLERLGLPATAAGLVLIVLTLCLALGLLFVLLPLIEREAVALNRELPALVTALDARLSPLIEQLTGVRMHLDPAALRALAMQQVAQQDVLSALLTRFGSGGLSLLGTAATMLLMPVVLFYLLVDSRHFLTMVEETIPPRWREPARRMLGECDTVLAQFLRGQLTVMLLLAVYYSSALALAGFESALPIGILTGLLIFIPYAGFLLGLTLAALVALLQFGTWQAGLTLAFIYGLGQILEGFVLTPRLVGKRIGLHPLTVIFSLLAFGQVFGFLGILVALPASAVLLVVLRHLLAAYRTSGFYLRP